MLPSEQFNKEQICEYCGTHLDANLRFCEYCGKPLSLTNPPQFDINSLRVENNNPGLPLATNSSNLMPLYGTPAISPYPTSVAKNNSSNILWIFGGITLVLITGIFIFIFLPEKYNSLLQNKPAISKPQKDVLVTPTQNPPIENDEKVNTDSINKDEIDLDGKTNQPLIAKPETEQTINTHKPTPSSTEKVTKQQLDQAKAAYLAAFQHYTSLVTEGGEGDVDKALKEYKEAYENYKELEKRAIQQK